MDCEARAGSSSRVRPQRRWTSSLPYAIRQPARHVRPGPGQPITAHWGFGDPAAVVGTREQQLKAFTNAQFEIVSRIRLLLSLPVDKLDRMSLQASLRELGEPQHAIR